MLAFLQNDFATAEADFQRALELNLSAYGENSNETATSLSGLARIYFTQKDFAKTEAVMTRSLKIFETMYGQDNFQLTLPVAGLAKPTMPRAKQKKPPRATLAWYLWSKNSTVRTRPISSAT